MCDELVVKRMEYAVEQHAKCLVRIADLETALRRVKSSIEQGARGGVTCTAWMTDTPAETICDFIDAALSPNRTPQTED